MKVGQDDFVGALLSPDAEIPPGLINPEGGPAGRRFNVYRNNVAVSLTEALETAFPVLVKLLGEENFKGLAGIFLRQHPPSSPLIMFYGEEMPDFLAGLPQLSHIPYLGDIARLELAVRHSYHAADAPVLDAQALQVAPDVLMKSKFIVHPAAHVISSAYPVHGIWVYNTEPDAPKPSPVAEEVVVTRPELDPIVTPLPNGSADFFQALADGNTFETAIESVEVDGFDLQQTLTALLMAGAFTRLEEAL